MRSICLVITILSCFLIEQNGECSSLFTDFKSKSNEEMNYKPFKNRQKKETVEESDEFVIIIKTNFNLYLDLELTIIIKLEIFNKIWLYGRF
jgi:hypothetical protein